MTQKRSSVASTVRTVDDVMSLMDINLPATASLQESRKFIDDNLSSQPILKSQTIDELENIHMVLAPIAADTQSLVTLMMKHNAMLGGAQATSFFYPICEYTDCPWDFFVRYNGSDDFVTSFKSITNSDTIEDVKHFNGTRIVHFRRNINGTMNICNIRVFVSLKHPLDCIMGLKYSYEQTVISASYAICFWPTLCSRKLYREFTSNPGLIEFPNGKTYYQIVVTTGTKTHLKNPMQKPAVYEGINKRVEMVIFKQSYSVDKSLYHEQIEELNNIVYAVHNSSTRYLGTTSLMK